MRLSAPRTSEVIRRFAIVATLATLASRGVAAQTPDEYQRAVNAAYEKYKNLHEGKNGD
jgi:hypothetical protein